MTPTRRREASGHVSRAPRCRCFVRYADDPEACLYIDITRVQARAILAHARERGIADVDIDVLPNGCVDIGAPFDFESESDEEE